MVLKDLKSDEIQVRITGALGLKIKRKDIYVQFSLGVPTDNPVGGTSETVQGGPDFTFDSTHHLPLRRSRGTQTSFEIRKAVFEVYRTRSYLRGPELVGKAYQELVGYLNDKILLDD